MVRVFLPPGYADTLERYPALLMWDGQNIFEDQPSYAGGWHVHRVVAARAAGGKVAPVVIGIDHGGPSRIQELSAWPTPAGPPLVDAMLGWIKRHLIPHLRSHVRLHYGPQHWVVGGSSMGGLASLYAHFRHHSLFGGVLAMSPSLFVNAGGLFDFVAHQPRPHPSRIYLDAGGEEGDGVMLAYAERLAQMLYLRGWGPESLRWRPVHHGRHSERHWAARLPNALRFLYG